MYDHDDMVGGGYSHVKAYGDVLPKWVTFSPKILNRHGSHFGQKSSQRRVPFYKICKKIVKSAVFEAEWVLICKNFEKTVYSVVFWVRKSLNTVHEFNMGRGFRPRAAHSIRSESGAAELQKWAFHAFCIAAHSNTCYKIVIFNNLDFSNIKIQKYCQFLLWMFQVCLTLSWPLKYS